MSPSQSPRPRRARTTIAVQGARVHNLKNVSVEIPRDRLIVVTGLSGSGKSSLAFDTIYAEGQRRYMESLSSYAKRFVAQVAKPDVDFVFGLSPVISIEQKTLTNNPRSTVGTMTDIASYLNLLYATIGHAHCPRTGEPVPTRTSSQILEAILALPEGTADRAARAGLQGLRRRPGVRLHRAPEEGDPSAHRRRQAGRSRRTRSRSRSRSVTNMDAIVDRFVVSRKHEKAIKAGIAAALLVGDGCCRSSEGRRILQGLGSKTHHFVYGDIGPDYFMFNNPESACRTCGGLGVDKLTHPELLVPDTKRSIAGGCFVNEAFKYNPETWDGRVMYSLSIALKFSLDTPWKDLSEKVRQAILYGIDRKITMTSPPEAKISRDKWEGQATSFHGIARRIERWYRQYRQRGETSSKMEAWLDKVMVERTCADCNGARLRATRLLFDVRSRARTCSSVGQLHFDELHAFLGTVKPAGRGADAGRQVLKEIRGRVELLLGIGLDYLSFNRRSGTLSGGESQRIRLSTQIGSGLMGMLYVLDEPSIGLHPKDNVKMIATLERLRDIGNTVIVVEHDEDTIRAADHIVEMGPGPGVHGGTVVVQGTIDNILKSKCSPTGQFLSGQAIDRDAEGAAQGHRQVAGDSRRAREQPQVGRRHHSSREAHRDDRRLRVRQEHAGQRHPLQGAVEAPGGHPHAAGRARQRRGRRARAQGRQHRSGADRPEQPFEPRDLHRLLRHDPRALRGGAAVDRPRLSARPVQLQRQGRPLRRVPGRGGDHHAALLHARRRGHVRRVQGRAVQQRDARGHAARQDD